MVFKLDITSTNLVLKGPLFWNDWGETQKIGLHIHHQLIHSSGHLNFSLTFCTHGSHVTNHPSFVLFFPPFAFSKAQFIVDKLDVEMMANGASFFF